MWIRANDTVVIIRGEDRGTRGKVLRMVRDKSGNGADRVVVEGVNRVYRHVRRSQRNPQGGRLSVEMPVPQSNVALLCPGLRQADSRRRPLPRRRRQGALLQEVRGLGRRHLAGQDGHARCIRAKRNDEPGEADFKASSV